MTQTPSRVEHLRVALEATREILGRLDSGELRATDLPAVLEARLRDLLEFDSNESASDDEARLAGQIRELDQQIMNWCQRTIGETRERLSRARRRAANPTTTPARLVSESA